MSVHRHNQLHDKPYLQDDAFLGGVRFNILLSQRPIRNRTMFPAKRNSVRGRSFHGWTFCIGNSRWTTNYALPVSRGLIFSDDHPLTALRPHIIYYVWWIGAAGKLHWNVHHDAQRDDTFSYERWSFSTDYVTVSEQREMVRDPM